MIEVKVRELEIGDIFLVKTNKVTAGFTIQLLVDKIPPEQQKRHGLHSYLTMLLVNHRFYNSGSIDVGNIEERQFYQVGDYFFVINR